MSPEAKHFWDSRYKTRAMVAPLDFARRSLAYLKKGASILDIGCGDGRDSAFFAQNGLAVTAIDFSAEAIACVKKLDPFITAQSMDILRMDFPDMCFDAVYAHLSVHYFDDPTTDAVFRSIHRMLKQGGFFFVKCKSTKDPLYGKGEKVGEDMYVNPYLRHFFSVEYMKKKLQDFTVLELQETAAAYDGKESAFVEAVAKVP